MEIMGGGNICINISNIMQNIGGRKIFNYLLSLALHLNRTSYLL